MQKAKAETTERSSATNTAVRGSVQPAQGHFPLGKFVVVTIGVFALTGAAVAFALTTNGTTHGHGLALAPVAAASPSAAESAPGIPTLGGASPGLQGFNAVTCPATTLCIGVGAAASGAGMAETSSDGGSTWTTRALPGGSPQLDAVACATTTTCAAVGPGTALATVDGGATWSTRQLPVSNAGILGVTCTSQLVCVAVGILPNQTNAYSGEADVSKDGGSTWTEASVPSSTPGLGAVACPTPARCIAVGATILTSDDAGSSWQQRTVNGGMQALTSITCSSVTVCLAAGPNVQGVTDPTAPAAAIISIDGGNTWNSTSFPAGSAGVQRLVCGGSAPSALGGLCYGLGQVLAKGGGPIFLTSGDGGQTWRQAGMPPGMTSLAALACSVPPTCVVVGQGLSGSATARTTDGTSWTTATAVAS